MAWDKKKKKFSTIAIMEYGKFVLFGDSITQFSCTQYGFHPALQNVYIRKLDVINRGFSGYNSEHARQILPKILESETNIKLMTIFFGTNDAYDYINEIQTVELDRYKDNLSVMVQMVLDKNIKPIIIGPGLHDPKMAKAMLAERGRPIDKDPTTNQRLLKYSETAKKVAAQHNVAFIDTWNTLRQYQGWTKDQLFEVSATKDKWEIGESLAEIVSDGIHFTAKSYKILFEEIIRVIEEKYPELAPENLPSQLCDWKQINPNDLSSIFN